MVSKDDGANAAETKPKPGLFKRMFGRKQDPAETARADPGAPVDAGIPEREAAPPDTLDVSGTDFGPGEPVASGPSEPGPKQSWWARLRAGLSRSSGSIGEGLAAIFTKRKLDASMLDDLEDVLIRADLGIADGGARSRKRSARAAMTRISASKRSRQLSPRKSSAFSLPMPDRWRSIPASSLSSFSWSG